MQATLRETKDGFECIDEYEDRWAILVDDGNGNAMVERDAGERWDARQFSLDRGQSFRDGATGTISDHSSQEGSTFGVNCQDEFIVERADNAGSLRWIENA